MWNFIVLVHDHCLSFFTLQCIKRICFELGSYRSDNGHHGLLGYINKVIHYAHLLLNIVCFQAMQSSPLLVLLSYQTEVR